MPKEFDNAFIEITNSIIDKMNLELIDRSAWACNVRHTSGAEFCILPENGRLGITTNGIRANDNHLYNLNVNKITLSMDKSIDQIAKDIQKRFIENLLPEYERISLMIEKANLEYARTKTLSEELLELTGGKNYSQYPDHAKIYLSDPTMKIEVRGMNSIRLEGDFNAEQIKKILSVIKP